MKKSLLKNNFREISKNKRRFISMLVMAFLGVGFFAGLVATSPDMLDSLDKYADKSNFYDINIISTLGITDDDIQAIKNIDGVENAYGIQTKDSMVKIDDKESVCKVIEYNENVNTPVVIAGRKIENDNECLLDNAIVRTGTGAEEYIGKKIVLENNDKDSDDNDIFTKKEFEEKTKKVYSNFKIDFSKEDCIKIKEYTEGNRVKLIKIGNLELSGVEVRTLLSLRSANFKVTIEKDNIIFEVTGYGHGVGMSQTGADSLAKQGKSYEEIIHHFYSGVKVQDI